jgi:hypothetical protein
MSPHGMLVNKRMWAFNVGLFAHDRYVQSCNVLTADDTDSSVCYLLTWYAITLLPQIDRFICHDHQKMCARHATYRCRLR